MRYNKEYVRENLSQRCEAYVKEIDAINDRLASGYYCFNPSVLNALRNRKGRLNRRIYNLTNVAIKSIYE